jgi:hypothetical protein
MKYRLITAALLLAVLGALAFISNSDSTTVTPTPQQPSSDDAALKSLSIN